MRGKFLLSVELPTQLRSLVNSAASSTATLVAVGLWIRLSNYPLAIETAATKS